MSINEVAEFADRFSTHNERIVVTLKDKTEIRGHFLNNPRLSKKLDNLWNFVILRVDNEENTKLVVKGEDILIIKKVIIF